MWRRLFSTGDRDEVSDLPEPSLEAALLSPRPSDIFIRWVRTGRLREILPDIDALRGISQAPAHRDDAFVHTMKVVDAIDPTPVRRWAALLHDVAKAPTYIETPEGRSRFFGHEFVGAAMVPEIMAAAGASQELITDVTRLVTLHMRPIGYSPDWTDSAVRRLREEAEEGRGPEGWQDLLALAEADIRGYLPEPIDRGLWVLESLRTRAEELDEAERRAAEIEASRPRSPLDGNDLLALADLEPGPWVGELKDYLKDEVIHGRLARNDVESARVLAREWLEAHSNVPLYSPDRTEPQG